jgi:hypothetical protein
VRIRLLDLAAAKRDLVLEDVSDPRLFQLERPAAAIGGPGEVVGRLLVEDVAVNADLHAADFEAALGVVVAGTLAVVAHIEDVARLELEPGCRR